MRLEPLTAAYLMAAFLVIGVLLNAMYQTWAPYGQIYKRVAIVERVNTPKHDVELTVRLAGDYTVPVYLDDGDDLHPDATFVCVAIRGNLEGRTANAQFADLKNCPLPVTRRLPQTSVQTYPAKAGKKTYRSMSVGGNSSNRTQPFPSRGSTVSR